VAIACWAFKGILEISDASDFTSFIDSMIEEIRAERNKKNENHAVLVTEIRGEIDVVMDEPCRQLADVKLTFDAIDKQKLRQIHRPDIEAIKVAVGLEGTFSSKFSILSDGIYLTNLKEEIIYSISFSTGLPNLVTSSWLSSESAERIARRFELLRKAKDLENINRLISQLTENGIDNFKAFLAGWAAFEILVQKMFKIFEDEFLSPIISAGQATLRERFLKRLKLVMNEKYRLADKFLVVAAVLYPDASEQEAQDDLNLFLNLKNKRDIIYHGSELSEQELPLYSLEKLLQKYLFAFIKIHNH
jgi:hypothetical protein